MKNAIVKQIIEDCKIRPFVFAIEGLAMLINLSAMLTLSIWGNDAKVEIILGLFVIGSLGFMYATAKRNLIIPLVMSSSYFIIELLGFIKATI